ncbi:amino acid transporter [Rhizodiscina lignyota]|uniref:Amino acid transporter n=1 Tax=Rhizodiscina lignyota TaxID=1504668 RepID=A0A9P4I6X8_9PEZI|nr:amino acid transporter [Rhizodiscina lignyota]
MGADGKLESGILVQDLPVGYRDDVPWETGKYGTEADRRDMRRINKRQELRRTFRFFAIFGYAVILGNTWEFALVTGIFSITNGGTAGAIWMFVVTCFGMFFVMLSMAEMASIAPTAGGQFHWVSEFAPSRHQKLLSFCVGWLCVLGWQSAMAVGGIIVAEHIQALMVLSDPSYVIKGWQEALFSIAAVIICILFNIFLVRKLPLFQGIIFTLHIFGFFAIVIVLWVLGPRSNAKDVFTTFSDNGWGSDGVSCLVGLLSPVITLIGADSSCHLSEEVNNASWVLPRAMVATACANYFLGLFMTITFMFFLGDINTALSSPTGMPYVEVLHNATQSKGATITLTSLLMVLLLACSVNQVTTSSRQLFAFARDGGLPFHKWLSYVRPGWDIPINALSVTLLVSAALSLLCIASPIAFNIISSISETGLLTSYIIAIGCILAKRMRGEPFPPSQFSLGNWGYVVNIIAMCFLCIANVFMFFPAAPNPTAETMNWNIVVYGSTVIFMLIYYAFRARHVYEGPVTQIIKDE